MDNKTKKNASDILALENKLKQKEDFINENERGLSFNRGFFFYKDQSYLTYECKIGYLVLVLLLEIYQNGNQLAFTIIQVILI